MTKRGEGKFFQTEEFKNLYATWVTGKTEKIIVHGKVALKKKPSKLAESGFEDIERPIGSLKTKNIRTQNYLQQEDLQRISSALRYYVENAPLHPLERTILELHAEGLYRKHIMERTQRSHQTVWRTIRKHLPIALGIYAREAE